MPCHGQAEPGAQGLRADLDDVSSGDRCKHPPNVRSP